MEERPHTLPEFPVDFQERVHVNAVTGCWHWTGRDNKSGYGVYRGKGAHVFACEFAHGPMKAGLFACHKCDMPRCVNPAHLYPGTNLQNIQDMHMTRRKAHGERVSKLSHEQVREILSDNRRLPWEIAKDFGISESTVLAIFAGNSWKHIERQRTFEEARESWLKLQKGRGKNYKRPSRQKRYWETVKFKALTEADFWLVRVLFEHAERSGNICAEDAEWSLPVAGLCQPYPGQPEEDSFKTQIGRIFSFGLDYSSLKRVERSRISISYPRTSLFSFFDSALKEIGDGTLRYGIRWDLIHVIEDNALSDLMDLIGFLHNTSSYVEQAELLEARRQLKESVA